MSKLKLILLVILVALFLGWATVSLFFSGSLYGLNENFFYWIELAALVYLAWVFELRSSHFLYPGLILVVLGAVLNVGGISFAEQIFRASIVFWLVGIGITLKELKNG